MIRHFYANWSIPPFQFRAQVSLLSPADERKGSLPVRSLPQIRRHSACEEYYTISAQGFQCRTPDIPTEHQTFLLFLEFSVCPMSSVCREGRPQYFQRKIQSIQTRFLIRLYVYSTQILSVHLYWISPSLRFLLIYTTVKNPSIHAAIICNAHKTIVSTDALFFLFTT